MTITTNRLTAAAGLAAMAAGAIFIGVQVGHPLRDTYLQLTDEWVVRCTAKAVMSLLALVGITGMYLRQTRQLRVLGLVGYLTFALGYLLMWVTEMVAVFFLPALTGKAPAFVQDVVVTGAGGHPVGDIGHLQVFFELTAAGYLVGGLLFGIALFRAAVLARWAAALLAVSTLATLALAVLPESFSRPMAVPEGIALIGLGLSLWRDQRSQRTAGLSTDVLPARAAATR